jgi:transcriptional regulator with XRE-family HTH domain
LALKLAIVATGKTQRAIAQLTRIPEGRLSMLVTGREDATELEKEKLAKALAVTQSQLFPEVAA